MSITKEKRFNKDGSYSQITTSRQPDGSGWRKTVTKEPRLLVDHVRSVKEETLSRGKKR
jgi:hypothetical protein